MRATSNTSAKCISRIIRNPCGIDSQSAFSINIYTATTPVGRGGSRVPLNSCGGNLSITEAFAAGLAIPVTPCEDAATLVLGRGVVQNGTAGHGEPALIVNEDAAAGFSGIILHCARLELQ